MSHKSSLDVNTCFTIAILACLLTGCGKENIDTWNKSNVQSVVNLLTDERLLTDDQYREKMLELEQEIPDDVKQEAARRIRLITEAQHTGVYKASAVTHSIPVNYTLLPIPPCMIGVPWIAPVGKCGSDDRDGQLSFYFIPNAYSKKERLALYETSIVLYSAICLKWGCSMTAYEITPDNTVRLCVGGPIGTAVDGFATAELLTLTLGLCGSF